MGYQGKFDAWTVQAKADLSDTTPGTGALYKAVGLETGDFVADGSGFCGLLQEGCSSGGHASIAYKGISKACFATAITSIGLDLTITTGGWLTLAASGDFVVGRNLTVVVSGGTYAAAVNFINPPYAESY